MLSAFMVFIEEGDESFVFEPCFNQYISNVELAGGVVRYVPLKPPAEGAIATTSSADWTLDVDALAKALSSRTKMIVINTPRNPVGNVFSYDELSAIANLALNNNIHLLSDEVYDSLYYVPMTRTATLSPEIWNLTLTVCSAGKPFSATGRHVGFLVGPAHLIKYVSAAHTRICYTSPSPLQEACAVGFSRASELGFWDASRKSMQSKIRRFVEVCDEIGLPYSKPEGGYFIMANFAKLVLPDGYAFPAEVEERPRDFGMLPWRKIGCDSRSVKNMMYWRMRKKG